MKLLFHLCVYVCVCLWWVCDSACWLGHDAEDVSFIYSKISLKGTDVGNRINRTWWWIGFRQWGNWDELRINHRFLAWLTGWRVLPFLEIGNAVRELVWGDSEFSLDTLSLRHLEDIQVEISRRQLQGFGLQGKDWCGNTDIEFIGKKMVVEAIRTD